MNNFKVKSTLYRDSSFNEKFYKKKKKPNSIRSKKRNEEKNEVKPSVHDNLLHLGVIDYNV